TPLGPERTLTTTYEYSGLQPGQAPTSAAQVRTVTATTRDARGEITNRAEYVGYASLLANRPTMNRATTVAVDGNTTVETHTYTGWVNPQTQTTFGTVERTSDNNGSLVHTDFTVAGVRTIQDIRFGLDGRATEFTRNVGGSV